MIALSPWLRSCDAATDSGPPRLLTIVFFCAAWASLEARPPRRDAGLTEDWAGEDSDPHGAGGKVDNNT